MGLVISIAEFAGTICWAHQRPGVSSLLPPEPPSILTLLLGQEMCLAQSRSSALLQESGETHGLFMRRDWG